MAKAGGPSVGRRKIMPAETLKVRMIRREFIIKV